MENNCVPKAEIRGTLESVGEGGNQQGMKTQGVLQGQQCVDAGQW